MVDYKNEYFVAYLLDKNGKFNSKSMAPRKLYTIDNVYRGVERKFNGAFTTTFSVFDKMNVVKLRDSKKLSLKCASRVHF